MSWVILIIVLLYAVLILEFAVAHWRLPDYVYTPVEHKQSFAIVIPFRNEAENLPQLLRCIEQLHYPREHFEVILINDASEDGSSQVVENYIHTHSDLQITLVDNERTTGSPKKDALTLGISVAKHNWIVTTDADCTFSPDWLDILNSFIATKNSKMVVGPVAISPTESVRFLNAFEQLDFLSLMGATIGGFGMRMPFLCNGAHLAYEKDAFYKVKGFLNNDHIASGDDHFLLEKFTHRFPRKVHYLKTPQATVSTSPQDTWASFIAQRVRWASKGKSYKYWFSKTVGILVLITNVCIAIVFLLLILSWIIELAGGPSGLKKSQLNIILIVSLFIKWISDYILIARTARFFKRKKYLVWYPLLMMCYPFITSFIAVKALLFPFEWKGRRFTE